jgi:hypothetical protein
MLLHPLAGDLSSLKDSELDNKIQDLTKKYFMTHNPGVQAQMVALLNTLKEEQSKRQQLALKKLMEKNSDKGLDKLINVN